MAFIDFAQPLAGPTGRVSAERKARIQAMAPAIDSFDPVEWQIVALARTDGLGSLRTPGRLDRVIALIFGARANRKLASDRLEALRRLAVEAWHRGYAVSIASLHAFHAAGFTTAQLELLLATISAGRSARGRRSFA
ncbi:hypothetical protein BH10PSE12_BH10PSE12_10000 [soil metagenome]